jgi:hypothetical protein
MRRLDIALTIVFRYITGHSLGGALATLCLAYLSFPSPYPLPTCQEVHAKVDVGGTLRKEREEVVVVGQPEVLHSGRSCEDSAQLARRVFRKTSAKRENRALGARWLRVNLWDFMQHCEQQRSEEINNMLAHSASTSRVGEQQ